MENGPFEDVFPIEIGGYSIAMLVFRDVVVWGPGTFDLSMIDKEWCGSTLLLSGKPPGCWQVTTRSLILHVLGSGILRRNCPLVSLVGKTSDSIGIIEKSPYLNWNGSTN